MTSPDYWRLGGFAAFMALAAACADGPAAPTLRSVTPSSGPNDASTAVTLAGADFGLMVVTDFTQRAKSRVDATYQARLSRGSESLALEAVVRVDGTTLQATVPAGVPLGTYDVTITDPYGRSATLPMAYRVLDPASPARLAFSTAPKTVAAGECSGAVTVELDDGFGRPVAAGADVPVSLSSSPTGVSFFSDSNCTTPAMSVTIAALLTSATLSVRSAQAGVFRLDAVGSGLATGSQSLTVQAGQPTKLAFIRLPAPSNSGACSGEVEVQAQDAQGNAVGPLAPLAIALTAAPASGFAFFADAACAVGASGTGLAAGQSSAVFRTLGVQPGTVTLTAEAPGLLAATGAVTVLAGAPVQLGFSTPAHTVAAGQCSPAVTVEARDAAGSPAAATVATVVSLTAAPSTGVAFHTDASCSGAAVTAVALAPGTASASVYFRAPSAGSLDVTAAATNLASATQTHAITSGLATRLAFLSAPPTVGTGQCTPPLRVQLADAMGNPVETGVARTITLAAAPAAGFSFYATPDCTGAAVTSVPLGLGASTATFSARGSAAGDVTVTAASNGLSPATLLVGVRGSGPINLAFASAAQAVAAGACSGVVTLEARDAANAPANVSAATPVSLAAAPGAGFAFYATAGCAGAVVGAVTLAGGTSTVSVYFKGTVAQPVDITASATGLNAATQTQTVTGGAAAAFAWDPIAAQVRDVAFPVTVRARDAFGNLATGFTSTAVVSLAPAGTVACTAGCTNSTTTGAFVGGVWTGSLAAGAPAGTGRTLTATAGTLSGTSNAFDVVAPPSGGGSPPVAHFTVSPAAVVVGATMSFDAAGSSDYETATSALEVSWDFSGVAAGPPPWTAWTTTKTAQTTYSSPGRYLPRLAVRDAAGNVAYATRVVSVVSSASTLCVVNTTSNAMDGASACAGPFGSDGKLSLFEAIAIANASSQKVTITFSGPMTIALPTPGSSTLPNYTLSKSTDVVAPSGVILQTEPIRVGDGVSVLMAGLELFGTLEKILYGPTSSLTFTDGVIRLGTGFEPGGPLLIERSLFDQSAKCVRASTATSEIDIRSSVFIGGDAVLDIKGCAPASGLSVTSSVFVGNREAIAVLASCNGSRIVNNTFHGNGTGIRYEGSSGHVLRNNIFSASTTLAASCGTATFADRDYQHLFQNVSNGCLGADPNQLSADPAYLLPTANDLRLSATSPARDTGVNTGVELNGPAPGLFFGAAPDRGGRETW